MQAWEYVRPSAAAQLLRCSGYAQLNAILGAPFEEDEDTEVREDGIACHWLVQHWQRDYSATIGEVAPNGRPITNEMRSAVDEYTLAMMLIAPMDAWHIEQTVPVSKIITGMQDGTPDAWYFDIISGTLYVFDLKFGFRYVDAYENIQLIIYALTISMAVLSIDIDKIKVKLAIFQPRAPNHEGSLRWWSPTATKLREFWAIIVGATYRALQPNAQCTPNAGCKHCPGAFGCHALRMAASRDTELSYKSVPAVLSNDRLGYELSIRHAALKTLEAQIAALETQAEHSLRHGERVLGYELAPRRTLWRWKDGAEQRLAALSATLGLQVTEVKTKSVANLRAQLPAALLEMYAEKPNGGLQLKATDPKEAERRFTQE